MRRLEGKVAVVTGAGGGIGSASALRMGEEGAKLALVDLRADQVQKTADQAQAAGIEAEWWETDVSDVDQVERTVKEIVERYGTIDVLHSNAGVLYAGTLLTQTVEEWDHTFKTNVRSMFLMARAVLPVMKANGGGSIITTGSTSGMVGDRNLHAYDSSKGAVINFTRQVAVDFGADNIRVNTVCPGWVDTGFNDPVLDDLSPDELEGLVKELIPLGRQGVAEDIAPAVAFLASDDARYITGSLLVVDGGATAQ